MKQNFYNLAVTAKGFYSLYANAATTGKTLLAKMDFTHYIVENDTMIHQSLQKVSK